MAEHRKGFLSRWSKRKLAAAQADAVPAQKSAAAKQPDSVPAQKTAAATDLPLADPTRQLPPLDQLTPDSDFSGFMNAKLDDGVRRAALKKLFSDPRFNVTDGLDDYAEDYTLLETLAPGVAEQLAHARTTLFGPDPAPAKRPAEGAPGGAADPQPQVEQQEHLAAAEPIRPDPPADAPDEPDPGAASAAGTDSPRPASESDSKVG